MGKICKNHGTCCKEWGIPPLIIGVVFLFSMIFPGKFGKIMSFIGSGVGMIIVGTCITTVTGLIVRRKMQVSAWERDRPFNDGNDDTPDPYLFNPGPGAAWGLRAFMPAVEKYSFVKTPISWLVRQAKRKVAILLDDGTVSFPWFLVAWISDAAGGGTRIPVPQGWKITALQADVLQKKRDEIKKIVPRMRTEYQRDFLLFTDLIFSDDAKIGREPVKVGVDKVDQLTARVDRIDAMMQQNIVIIMRDMSKIFGGINDVLSIKDQVVEPVTGEIITMPCQPDTELAQSNRDVARSLDRLSATMQHFRKALVAKKKDGGNPPKKP